MEKKEWIEGCKRIFTKLVRDTLWEDFKFPGGGMADRCIGNCYDAIKKVTISISRERLVDFCICQVYAMREFGRIYRNRWNASHSFGDKALQRYNNNSHIQRCYENRWLESNALSRENLVQLIADRSHHPLENFIYPEYEDGTKRRLLSTDVGYIICGTSTLMWTPFSPVCQECSNAALCRKRTSIIHRELFRIRCTAWEKKLSNEHN